MTMSKSEIQQLLNETATEAESVKGNLEKAINDLGEWAERQAGGGFEAAAEQMETAKAAVEELLEPISTVITKTQETSESLGG